MFRNILNAVVFLAGLVAVVWIGAGYLGSNLLGVAVTGVIAACYLAGALELYRYRQATWHLTQALGDVGAARSGLDAWLQRLSPALRNPVRLRIEGERVALPAPVLTPYLVGLLVLLGMLGTLLGMMATLRGTGIALESASDLDAIRGSLGAPVKGLAFAFGTSIAGVASSAMLGLLSSLCRRERLQSVQQLDRHIALELRPLSRAHQREESLRLLQQQAEVMPTLVERLQTMIAAIEQHSSTINEQMLHRQQDFHTRTEASYVQLAASIEQSLKAGVSESATAVRAALQPLVQSTMTGIASETTAMQQTLTAAVQRQLDAVSASVQRSSETAAASWESALDAQQQSNAALTADLHGSLERFSQTFEQRASTLVETIGTSVNAGTDKTAASWNQALAEQQRVNAELLQHQQQALTAAVLALENQSSAVITRLQQAQSEQQAINVEQGQRNRQALAETSAALENQSSALIARMQQAQSDQQALNVELGQHHRQAAADAVAAFENQFNTLLSRLQQSQAQQQTLNVELSQQQQKAMAEAALVLETQSNTLVSRLQQAQDEQQKLNTELSQHHQQTLTAASAALETHSSTLITRLQQSQADLQASLESRDQQRLTLWSERLEGIATALDERWQHDAEQAASQQQNICETLSRTASDIASQAQTQAHSTISEVSRLVQIATEAPRAAADVIAELRQQLSASMVHDNAMLDERNRLLSTLETLLQAVNHASSEQRVAVDTLVATSADLLDRVGSRFSDQVDAGTSELGSIAAQVTGSAVEVASLGETLGMAVELFGRSNEALMERLQVIADGMDKSLARSDEQLAYYVAQAREVVDLSMLSQKQIIAELQQLAARPGSAVSVDA